VKTSHPNESESIDELIINVSTNNHPSTNNNSRRDMMDYSEDYHQNNMTTNDLKNHLHISFHGLHQYTMPLFIPTSYFLPLPPKNPSNVPLPEFVDRSY